MNDDHFDEAKQNLASLDLPDGVRYSLESLVRELQHRVESGGTQTVADVWLHDLVDELAILPRG